MTHHVLVAEPSNETWKSIAHGVRQCRAEATLLRVKDGEQAVRSLFQQGLLMDEPETPCLIVLNSKLPIIPLNIVIARIRQHPRTQAIPVIVISREASGGNDDKGESQQWLHRHAGVIVITGEHKLEKEVADAASRLLTNATLAGDDELTGIR